MTSGVTARDKVFETAARLFFQHGYQAVGVDRIAAESGVGKMTLYRHFPSKDDLILAYLRRTDAEFWGHFERSTQGTPTARGKLLAFFESLQAYVTSSGCYGCPFINVAAEFPDPQDAGHALAFEHKQAVRLRFEALAAEAGARQPAVLAGGLLLLMDGGYMSARLYGATVANPAHQLAAAARHLIDAQCGAPSTD